MTIRHLKIFITVAECGKMRKAAELLYISQPSVSQAISELEKYYGVKLFERLSQRIYLTEAGKDLLESARHLVNSFDHIDSMMKQASHTPIVKLGGSVSVGTCFFDSLTMLIENEFDHIDLRVTINNTEYIEKEVLLSHIDLGIVEGLVKSKDIVKIPLYKDELVIVVGKTHPFFNKDSILLEDLNGQAYISREDGSHTRNQYETILSQNNIQMINKWVSTNTESIKKAVIKGSGLAIMSKLIILDEIKTGTLRIVPVEHIQVKRDIHLIYHKDKYLSQELNKIIHIIQTTITN